MLRWSVLLVGLASSGCVLGDGIDLPSTSGDGNGPTAGEDLSPDDGGLTDGGSNGPPNDMGSPAGSGGSPCCEEPPPGDAGSFGGEAP